jgi:Outer membrane protein beta-barrel domain
MKYALYAFLVLFSFSLPALGQEDLEFTGGYRHASGDGGLDGYTVGAGWNPVPHFQLFLDFDSIYDHSNVSAFALTQTGTTIINSHLTEFLTGPRYLMPGLLKGHGRIEGHRIIPWAGAGFGEARLHSEVRQQNLGTVQAADTAFVWMLNGGADWRLHPHWAVRGDVGLLRTHIASSGQSRLRIGITAVWSWRSRAEY